MQISDLQDIYDGVFVEGELYIGVVFDNEKKFYVFGQFYKKSLVKIYSEGKGFPFELMPIYKHNIYQINLSYYYKYTSNELVFLNDIDRTVLYNLAMFNHKYNINKSICISEPSKKNNQKKTLNDDHLITFGNEEEEQFNEPINEKDIIHANKLKKDPSDSINFVYFLDDGEPFEPSINSPKSFQQLLNFTHKNPNPTISKTPVKTNKNSKNQKENPLKNSNPFENGINNDKIPFSISTPKKSKTKNISEMGFEIETCKKKGFLLKSQEKKIKNQWNEKDRIIKKNKSLEKLDVMVDDTKFKNKYQEILSRYMDREYLIQDDEGFGRGVVHDFTNEVYQKKNII